MKKKKLKSYVIPSLYACFFVGVLFITVGVCNLLIKKPTTNEPKENINYVSESIIDDNEAVVKEVNKVLKPYTNDKVKIGKYFYDYKADETRQQNSITYHDNTYMQNSGVDYTLGEVFDINSILDGTVTSVTKDDLLGNCVEIKHDNDYTSIYQSLSEVSVKKGDKVTAGQVIGKSGQNTLDKDMGNHLHFELYIKGQVVDPLNYLDKDLSETTKDENKDNTENKSSTDNNTKKEEDNNNKETNKNTEE